MTATADLVVDGLTVRFGGLVAVDGVGLTAPGGAITALIGPNGAGKTTTFNACAGVVPASRGSVRLGPATLDGQSPARRAQLGLGRTFQRVELFDRMTVAANVAMGPESLFAGRRPWRQLRASRRERDEALDRAAEAMRRCGIAHLSGSRAGELSTGQRRLVELARAIATPFSFLLLDEPSSGLDIAETEALGAILVDFVAGGTGILLVEHDMTLVRAVCSYCYVLDFGTLILHGTTAEALDSETVRAAYLGHNAVAEVGR